MTISLVPSCHPEIRGQHQAISVTNNSRDTIVTDWGDDTISDYYSINWLLKCWDHNPNLITPPQQTNDWAISERYPSTFEQFFKYERDTLFVYIVKQQDLELANKDLILSFNYIIYKCTLDNLANNDWKIIYPDMSEDYYYVEKTYNGPI